MDRVATIESFILTVPRDEPYLGALRPGEEANAQGYFVRKGNRTVYPTVDRSVILRLETEAGIVGWGETYGLVAPRATIAIIDDLLAHFVVGRNPADAVAIYDDLYNLMRVRGYAGGYYHDALAAIDIALWDAAAKMAGLPLADFMGGRRHGQIPAYVSGLPKQTRGARAELAQEWLAKGFDSFKFAAPVADDGIAAEIETLRSALGPSARIACDMHWTNTAAEAVDKIGTMEPHGLWFAEAPVEPEDVAGLAQVARSVETPIAAGEEWRTVFDARLRFDADAVQIVQPEMGHTGVTQFLRIAQEAEARGLKVIPHATIGAGLFLAASIQASSTLASVEGHEFQHSIVERNNNLVSEGLECAGGVYRMGDKVGIGVEPTEEALGKLEK